MDFTLKYKNIIKVIDSELSEFERLFDSLLKSGNECALEPVLAEYFAAKGKLLRPVLIFLLCRAMNVSVDNLHYKLAFASEMIHNATLVHDDIIDSSTTRRGKQTLSDKYDSKLAVLVGDYLLAMALKALSVFKDERIIQIHSSAIENLVCGEIGQYFSHKELIGIDSYLVKSKNKTAELFKAGLCSACVLCGEQRFIPNIEQFALNFGIAFQIHNDLDDIFSAGNKMNEDIKNGIYTAPWIFYLQDCGLNKIENTEDKENIESALLSLKNSTAVEKTKQLIYTYINKAIENLADLEDNHYKQALIEICRLYVEG